VTQAGQARAAPAFGTTFGRLWALVSVDLRQVSIAEGLRAALSVAVIVALNELLEWPPLMEAALAALLTCLCDPGGPIGRRIPAIIAFGVLGAAITVGFGVLRNAPLGVVIPLACAGIFCSSFARVLGQPAQLVGNLLTVVQVLALTRAIGSVDEAASLGGAFLGGGLWAALLTLAIWRLHPYAPARRAVATAYQELARLAHDMRLVLNHPEPHETIWDRHASAHRRTVRDAIERARAAVLATVRAHGPVSGRASQTFIRLEAADQIFGALIALSDLLASDPDAATRAAGDRMLRLLRSLLVVLARAIVADAQSPRDRLERVVQAIAAAAPEGSSLHPVAEVLAERLRVPITLAAPDGWRPGLPAEPPPDPPWRRAIGGIRNNLTWQSEALRHALRNAATAAPAFAITLYWPAPYEHWLTITLVMTMQPYVALTYVRALERIAGTIAGGLIAAVIATFCTTPIAIAAALFPLAVIALSVRPASFALFIACLTPLVVLLSELGRPGESELTIAAMRALYSAIGGGLAVVAALLLWPSWEPGRVARDLKAAILAHGAYARAELGVLLGEATPVQVDLARRGAGVACNNLEATLQRALLEPGDVGRLDAAMTIDAALRRMAGRLTAMQLDSHGDHDLTRWRAWAEWIEDAARRIAEGGAVLPPRPKLPPGDPQAESLVRIARQLETSASAMRRLG
jgi:uncharacterized membrane protein YccC